MAQQELSVRHDVTAIKTYIFKKEMKLFRMAGFLLGYFAFAWTPFIIFEFVYITCRIETDDRAKCEVERYLRVGSIVNVLLMLVALIACEPLLRSPLKRQWGHERGGFCFSFRVLFALERE